MSEFIDLFILGVIFLIIIGYCFTEMLDTLGYFEKWKQKSEQQQEKEFEKMKEDIIEGRKTQEELLEEWREAYYKFKNKKSNRIRVFLRRKGILRDETYRNFYDVIHNK